MIFKSIKLTCLLSFLIFSGCSKISNKKSKTIKDGIKNYFEAIYAYKNGVNTDIKIFVDHNRKEILNTIEVTDIKNIPKKNAAIAFFRYSVGSTIVRRALWFHKVNDTWAITANQSMEYNYEAIGYEEKDDLLKKLIKRKKKWMEDNPDVWWLQYI